MLSFKQVYKPGAIFLMETKVDSKRLEYIRVKLGFAAKLVVDCVGKSGGLCLLWSNEVDISLLSYSRFTLMFRRRFHFEESWAGSKECAELISSLWGKGGSRSNMHEVMGDIKWCSDQPGRWNSRCRKKLRRSIFAKQQELKIASTHIQTGSWNRIRNIERDLDVLLERDEIYWRQLSKTIRLKHGDRNTKYFHSQAATRRAQNKIKGVFENVGVWREDKHEVADVVLNYFSDLFDSSRPTGHQMEAVFAYANPCLSTSNCAFLDSDFSVEEVKQAVFGMFPTKALGLDEDASQIMSLPLSSLVSIDSLFWHYKKLGTYSVRSGYRVGCSLLQTSDTYGLNSSESWWKFFWCVKVPSKVKLLLWDRPQIDEFETLCIILWRIWCRRNERVHKSGSLYDEDIVPWATSFVSDFRSANLIDKSLSSTGAKDGVRWKPPLPGVFKINIDVAIDGINRKVGVGIIIRNAVGISLGLVPCTVESDALSVVSLINNSRLPCAEIGIIVQYVILLLGSSPNCCVVFAYREANMSAHNLAKLGLHSVSKAVWMEDYPPSISSFVLDDCPDQV
ncbi:hypothetical protein Dsin_015466 [Dipteronia sinensis]|uniref:RNase H type-1 domain-containing protein n=1 Tax=Dipteronia sinensis TaxID=43782 RepID=A0AAE0ACM0_9ROSI|nr:hypothetical protein Dsin_015466 [Dipteronia sinensis]